MEAFLKVLDPDDSTTGGGSAAAIGAAMAGSLVAMAARLSAGDGSPLCARIYSQTSLLSGQLLAGSQADAQAFQQVRSAYQLPRQDEAEKAARQQAVQAAWLVAAGVPLENAARCLEVYGLGVELLGFVNPKVLSDLRCGLELARAGLVGCLENVQINLPAIKDEAEAARLAGQAAGLARRFADLAVSFPLPFGQPTEPTGEDSLP